MWFKLPLMGFIGFDHKTDSVKLVFNIPLSGARPGLDL